MFVFKKSISSLLVLATFLSATNAFAMNPGDEDKKVSAVAPRTAIVQQQEELISQPVVVHARQRIHREDELSTGAKVGLAIFFFGAILGISKAIKDKPKKPKVAPVLDEFLDAQYTAKAMGEGLFYIALSAVAGLSVKAMVNRSQDDSDTSDSE
jgi:hypothetical protein